MGDRSGLDRMRVDIVGSMLRPGSLREAFAGHAAGRVTDEELVRAQDDAVRDLVAAEIRHGLPVITDGEYRRTQFMQSFADVAGFDRWQARHDAAASGRTVRADRSAPGQVEAPSSRTLTPATEPLRLRQSKPLDEYRYAASLTGRPVKATVIGPDRIMQVYDPEASRAVYPDPDGFLADVVRVEREIVTGLAGAGCRYVHLDAPGFTAYVDAASREKLSARGWDPDDLMTRTIAAENAVIDGFPGVTFGIHLCRGNERSHWHREGPYDAIAERLFGSLRHQRLMLEYDTERAGTFAPLRYVAEHATVVLGLISTKTGALETVDDLCRRVDEAARYVPLNRLAISPQCGFASTIEGNDLTPDAQWAKLDLMLTVAEKVWG